MTTGAPTEAASTKLFTRFLDALYPAALGEAEWAPALAALFELGAGGGSEQRRMLFDAAVRHVKHALAIDQRLGSVNQQSAVMDCAASSLPCGVLLLDAQGAVLFASDRANALLRHRQGVQMECGRLRSLRGLEDRTLPRALAGLLATSGGTNGAACLDLPAHGTLAPLRLLLMRAAETLGAGAILGLAFEQGIASSLPNVELLRDLYGLSAAEAQLAGLLISGQTLGEAARTRSVSVNTVRSQLKGVLRKTGSRNQADLMRTLIGGPAGLMQGLTTVVASAT
jgi:DNA-binding CsgD family transcriptional regulator